MQTAFGVFLVYYTVSVYRYMYCIMHMEDFWPSLFSLPPTHCNHYYIMLWSVVSMLGRCHSANQSYIILGPQTVLAAGGLFTTENTCEEWGVYLLTWAVTLGPSSLICKRQYAFWPATPKLIIMYKVQVSTGCVMPAHWSADLRSKARPCLIWRSRGLWVMHSPWAKQGEAGDCG